MTSTGMTTAASPHDPHRRRPARRAGRAAAACSRGRDSASSRRSPAGRDSARPSSRTRSTPCSWISTTRATRRRARKGSTCWHAMQRARPDAAGGGDDRVGQRRRARSRRCAAARATTSRSRGTTSGCWPRCARRSSCARALRREPAAARARTGACSARALPRVHRRVAGDAAGAASSSSASAPSDANVLITGEHGTGKEVVAQLAARRVGRARRGRSSTVNAGGLSEGVFESELFGHVKGAFTDAQDRPHRLLRARRRRHAVPRRDRQHAARAAGEAAARAADRRVRSASARRGRGTSTCACSSATNADLAAEIAGGPLPRGSALPAEHGRDPPAAAARAARGHRRRSPRTSSRDYAARYRKPLSGFDDGGAAGAAARIAGRATCASWSTRSSARC